jgi:hypothetical protein
VISDAKVTVVNTQTGATRDAVSNETGLYRVTNLVPGTYRLTVEKDGFKTTRFENLVLTVDQTFTLDARMEVGTLSTSTEVNASELPPVELENAQISNLVDSKRITELPLLTRDPYQLILLSPGVVQSNTGLGGFSANGTSERNNNFLLDGVDNNDTEVPGIAGGLNSLNPDSTQEFRVITNNFLPEYGRNNGAVIEVITKSGTNQLHGTVYWFGRYNALGARDFFNPGNGPNGAPQNPYVRNDFGASAGGPIKKDKTFWFANYEGQRFVTTLTNQSVVPTAQFKTGTFTALGTPIDVSTPASNNNGLGLGLDPVMQKIFSLFPSPNGPAVLPGVTGTLFFPSASRQQTDDFTIKLDHNLTKKHVLSGRYAYNRFTDPNAFHTDFLPGGLGAIGTYQRTQNGTISMTSTLTDKFINEFRFGANRTDLQFTCNGTSTFDGFGFVDSFGRGADYAIPFGTPTFNGFGCQQLGDTNSQVRYTGTYQTLDNMNYSKGNHLLKWGAEFRDVYSNSFDNFFTRSTFDFNSFTNGVAVPVVNIPAGSPLDITANPGNIGQLVSLQNAVSSLLGFVDFQFQNQYFNHAQQNTSSDLRGFRQREWAGFIQDTWKLRPNFTLNYGMRYEYYGVPFEINNNLSALFQDASGPAPFTFTTVGPGTGHNLYKNQYKNFEPRIGFAWDPFKNGKTSIRAGFGIFHDRIFGNLVGNARGNPPFQQTFFASPSAQVSTLAAPTLVPTSATLDDGAGFFATLFDPNFKTPDSQNWNFGVQHAITPTLTLEVNYVGVKGTHLFRVVDANPPQPNLVSQLLAYCVPGNAFGCSSSTLQFGSLWFGAENGNLPFDATNNNAFNNAGSAPGSAFNESTGNSIYHGLQVNLQKRMSHGLQIQGAYTFAHAISDVNDPLNPALGNQTFPRDSFDLRAERGNSDFDIRHRGVINFIYEPNIGRGRGHLSSGMVGRLLEGWSVSGVIEAQTGHPYDILGNVDSDHTGEAARGTIIGPTSQPTGTDKTFTGPAASGIEITPLDVTPNIGKNAFYGPNLVNVDTAVLKDTGLTERFHLQFRLEVYNLFNHTQFTNPDNLLQDNTFGQSLSTVTRPDGTTSARQMQAALKIIF